MKHVPRLKISPEGLDAYCSTASSAVLDPSRATATWREFRDQAPYTNALTELTRTQQGLCCYCEQRLTDESGGKLVPGDYQIEHVESKAGGPGRTLDWTNFMLACCGGTKQYGTDESRRYAGGANLSCGQCKDNEELPQGTDPRDFPWHQSLVNVDGNGRLTANDDVCNAASVNSQALQLCIDRTLNLNADRLCLARIAIIEEVLENLHNYKPLLEGDLTDEKRAQARKFIVETRLKPDKHGHLIRFWTTERLYLPGADKWVADNHALFGFD